MIPKKVKDGIYCINSANFSKDKLNDFISIEGFINEKSWNIVDTVGVVDDLENLLSLYDFNSDPRNLAIILTPIYKKDQPKIGGWRWHKWGTYYGKQKPKHEYLYNEDIELVYVYRIVEIQPNL